MFLKKLFQELAQQLLPIDDAANYNQAIMDFGATVCKPANPKCNICPLRAQCRAYKSGSVNQLPIKSKRTKVRARYFNYLVITSGSFVYLKKRTGKDIWENLYEPVLIESSKLFTMEEMKKENLFLKLLENNSLEILEQSKDYTQRLTHQLITGQFFKIIATSGVPSFPGYKALPAARLKDIAFPKIVANYLKDYDISLNLNFQMRK